MVQKRVSKQIDTIRHVSICFCHALKTCKFLLKNRHASLVSIFVATYTREEISHVVADRFLDLIEVVVALLNDSFDGFVTSR